MNKEKLNVIIDWPHIKDYIKEQLEEYKKDLWRELRIEVMEGSRRVIEDLMNGLKEDVMCNLKNQNEHLQFNIESFVRWEDLTDLTDLTDLIAALERLANNRKYTLDEIVKKYKLKD